MPASFEEQARIETDPRFPSGPWSGFYLQPPIPGRFLMVMLLVFKDGHLTGSGRDIIGTFLFKGTYDLASGACRWVKSYLGKHDVFYEGQNHEGFIHGAWTIGDAYHAMHGGFVIWPEGMADPTQGALKEALSLPGVIITEEVEQEALVPSEMGADD